MQILVLLCILTVQFCVALQERLIATGTKKPSPTKTTVKGVEKCFGDGCEPEDDIAIPPDNKACKACCPRPKVTVTVTSTAYSTEVCTHTISRDRTQFTTVRFTNTYSTISTRTKSINFVNTTTIIGSRQVTTFHTVLAVKYNYFTIFTTIFTSWQLATAVFTTRIPTTRTTSVQVRATVTGTDISAITIQEVSTFSTTIQTSIGGTQIIGFNSIITITSTEVEPVFVYGETVWQDSPLTLANILSITYNSFEDVFILDNTIGVWYSYETISTTLGNAKLVLTNTVTTFTGTVAIPHTSAATLTFSKLYPFPPIPPGFIWLP